MQLISLQEIFMKVTVFLNYIYMK